MPDTAFRVFLNGTPATREWLDQIERIVVRQEMDAVWEAEVTQHTCLDAQGGWQHRADEIAPFTRVRIELRQGDGAWTPLIEGPVARSHSRLSAQPGTSEVSFTIRDDSVFLNRSQLQRTYEQKTDREIIDAVVADYLSGPAGKVPFRKDVATIPNDVPGTAVCRQTPIQFLRQLAHERGWHAYVLPATDSGQPSAICFKPKPAPPAALPPLKLLGDDRTLQEFSVEDNPEGPQRTRGARMDFAAGRIVTAESNVAAQPLLAALPPIADDSGALRHIDPADGTRRPPEVTAKANTETSTYIYKAKGRLVPGRYANVLVPYQLVPVRAGATGQSSNYLLRKVTHTLTRSLYTQEFEALGNSLNVADAAPSGSGPAGLTASVSISLSLG